MVVDFDRIHGYLGDTCGASVSALGVGMRYSAVLHKLIAKGLFSWEMCTFIVELLYKHT